MFALTLREQRTIVVVFVGLVIWTFARGRHESTAAPATLSAPASLPLPAAPPGDG